MIYSIGTKKNIIIREKMKFNLNDFLELDTNGFLR